MIAVSVQGQEIVLSPLHRLILSDLVNGAVLIKRFGGYETYREEGGRVLHCGHRMSVDGLSALLRAVPDLLPLRQDLGDDVLRLPAACRAAYADVLQASMQLGHLIVESEPSDRQRVRSAEA